MEAIKRGYQENRRILIEGLPKAGLSKFLPADGAFYLYADVSDFTADSFEFAGRMLEKAHVAATPGVDFDPIHGRSFIRFSYARSADEMREAVRASRAGSVSTDQPIIHIIRNPINGSRNGRCLSFPAGSRRRPRRSRPACRSRSSACRSCPSLRRA